MLEDYHDRKLCNQTLKEIHAMEIHKTKRFSHLPSVKGYIKTLEEIIQDEEEVIKSIHAALDKMRDPLSKRILISKFIERKDQQEISEQENYSYYYISRLMTKAIDEFQNI